jgi:ribosomal protein L11 methylase PrmA
LDLLFLSTYITKSLKTISDRINETSLSQKNKKIVLEASSKEINLLIKSYNRMVEELEISAIKLAQREREEVGAKWQNRWHMRLNPLTPMRLTVQSF